MTLRTMDEWQVRKRLKAACDKAGGQDRFAEIHKLAPSYVHDVRAGRRAPGAKLLTALGLQPVIRYARKAKGRAA